MHYNYTTSKNISIKRQGNIQVWNRDLSLDGMEEVTFKINFWKKSNKSLTDDIGEIGSVLGVLWKDWCWSWNSNTLATSCEELTYWKRLWCWEGFGAGGEGDDRGWDGWMASLTQWTWVWVNSGSWWSTGRPGMLRFMGSQSRTRLSDWTELNWMCYNEHTVRLKVYWKMNLLHLGSSYF